MGFYPMGSRFERDATINGLQLLRESLDITPRSSIRDRNLDDVVFVAIDFENGENIGENPNLNRNSQLGIAILDTRDLMASELEDEEIITTFNLETRDLTYKGGWEKPEFLFGETEQIHRRNMLATLESLIPPHRNIVLVGHAIHEELKVLHRLGFDFYQTSIVGILDTQKIFAEHFPTGTRSLTALCHLLRYLECPFDFKYLHNSGNDAHFTLRALLLLAIRNHMAPTLGDCERMERIRDIAQKPLFNGKQTKPIPLRLLQKEQQRVDRRNSVRMCWIVNRTRCARQRRLKRERLLAQRDSVREMRAARRLLEANDDFDIWFPSDVIGGAEPDDMDKRELEVLEDFHGLVEGFQAELSSQTLLEAAIEGAIQA